MRKQYPLTALLLASAACCGLRAAVAQVSATASVKRHAMASSRRAPRPLPSSVMWLVPLQPTTAPPPDPAHAPYTLLQKKRMFMPHVLVVPVGTPVSFPNADPFFHNVFSLYNGKRFDLGLYEKGTNRQVVFSREGVSYIFCNIHPEMSAVVLALRTPWWALADENGALKIDHLPPGDYDVHLWVEGADQRQLDQWTRRVRLTQGAQNVGTFTVEPDALTLGHTNKFGEPYSPDTNTY